MQRLNIMFVLFIADPNFYSTNLLMLGKTYLRMKNNKMALIYLQRAKDLPVKTPDDRNVSLHRFR